MPTKSNQKKRKRKTKNGKQKTESIYLFNMFNDYNNSSGRVL